MSAQPVQWDGGTIAFVVSPDGGDPPYLVPPVVFDDEDNVVMGREVLEAIVLSGQPVACPVLHGYGPGKLAELEQQLQKCCEELGIASSTIV
jgi:hypothetical protein